MNAKKASPIVVSESDYERLCSLIEHNPSPAADALEKELDRAKIVPAGKYPKDSVSMNAEVVFEDLDNGKQETVRLVFPWDADVEAMKISVLSPVGSALIGLKENGEISWPVGRGRQRNIRIVRVRQPESTKAA